jgi:hypothetical protein
MPHSKKVHGFQLTDAGIEVSQTNSTLPRVRKKRSKGGGK